ncbi:MAG: hypothetical protein U0271_00195 [Polyangiaceae bacterium]
MSEPPSSRSFARPRRRLGRRGLLLGGLGLAAGAAATAAIVHKTRADARARDAVRGGQLAQQANDALRSGQIRRAVKLANDALAAAPEDASASLAWLHATGLDFVDGDGTPSDAVGYVWRARALGARRETHAFASLCAAIAMKNDRFARQLLEQHTSQRIEHDAFYDLVAGAAEDLDCDRRAERSYAASMSLWVDSVLPRLRRARALLFVHQFDEAERELAPLGEAHPFARVLLGVSSVLRGVAAAPAPGAPSFAPPVPERPYVDPFTITDLPRCIRVLGQALTLSEENDQAGIGAALSDVDTAQVALLASEVAVALNDLSSADQAALRARELRSDLGGATMMLVRVRLLMGDVALAREAADGSGEPEALAMVNAIEAYESGKLDALKEAVSEARERELSGFALADAAAAIAAGDPWDTTQLERAARAREPWALELLFDLRLANGDLQGARTVTQAWRDERPARERRKLALADREKAAKKP